jgi:hypothetical protein
VSDIDTVVVNSLKALDPEWPIREADKSQSKANVSAYRTAQDQGKPASSPFAKKR